MQQWNAVWVIALAKSVEKRKIFLWFKLFGTSFSTDCGVKVTL